MGIVQIVEWPSCPSILMNVFKNASYAIMEMFRA
jgi:hypothetical protein